jgi:hypothetical protein
VRAALRACKRPKTAVTIHSYIFPCICQSANSAASTSLAALGRRLNC